MRSTLSPAFTSSKMKHMLPFIVEVGNQMVNSLKTKILDSKSEFPNTSNLKKMIIHSLQKTKNTLVILESTTVLSVLN